MSRILGYFAPHIHAEQQVEYAQYAGNDVDVPDNGGSTAAMCRATHSLSENGLHIGIAGWPIFRNKAIVPGESRRMLSLMLTRYRDVGSRLLDEIEGSFALAILDPNVEIALIAVDRMGVEKMTYSWNGRSLTFGNSANDVAGFPNMERKLRHQAFYDFLFMHMVPAPETVYESIRKLPPATVLLCESGRCRLERYWQPSYNYAGNRDFSQLRAGLRAGLERAVDDSGLDEPTGAFLSGGLDSSSVAGTLSSVLDQPVKTFTVGFGEADYDELKFARIANQHFGCKGFEYQMTPADVVDAFPRIAAAYDEPFGNSSAAPTYFCAKLAADNGVTHVLAGDGGDELFGGNERYLRQRIFETYFRLPRWLRHGIVEPAARAISPDSKITPLRKARSYVDQALIPLPERFESWNFVYREGGERMLHADFAATIDRSSPTRLMAEVWNSAPTEDLLERMLWYDWRFTLADNDLRKVNTMCELAGVRVTYPMLHPAVVNLSTQIPPGMKIKGMDLRHFFKRAVRDFLPGEIIEKKKHGFGLPFGIWLKTDAGLRDLIYSHLADLKKRQIISAEFIDELIEKHHHGHPSYYGYAIWVLAMLEAWMAHHIDRS